jgi:hypothetical protein
MGALITVRFPAGSVPGFPACNTENLIYVFLEMKLQGLVPNSYIHVSVSNFYISRISLPIWLHQIRQIDPGNVEIGRQNITILFWK